MPCPHCGGSHAAHSAHSIKDLPRELAAEDPVMDELYLTLIKKVYDTELAAGMIDADTALETVKTFMKGVFEGYGKTFPELEFGTPDYEQLASLEKSVYQFSAAKNYQQLKDLSAALKDGDRVRTFKEFETEAKKIVEEYNRTFLATEYETAIGSSQMAAKWTRFQEDKDVLPNLRFMAIEDERECPICKPFNNMVRPINDPVWKYAFSPLHWRCRCDVIQEPASAQLTPDDQVEGDGAIPKIFRTNLAEDGVVFPPKHPYYIGVPKDELKAFVKQHAPDRDK